MNFGSTSSRWHCMTRCWAGILSWETRSLEVDETLIEVNPMSQPLTERAVFPPRALHRIWDKKNPSRAFRRERAHVNGRPHESRSSSSSEGDRIHDAQSSVGDLRKERKWEESMTITWCPKQMPRSFFLMESSFWRRETRERIQESLPWASQQLPVMTKPLNRGRWSSAGNSPLQTQKTSHISPSSLRRSKNMPK